MTLLSSSRSVLLIPSSEIVSTWRSLVPGHLLGGSVHAMALHLGLLQYRQKVIVHPMLALSGGESSFLPELSPILSGIDFYVRSFFS